MPIRPAWLRGACWAAVFLAVAAVPQWLQPVPYDGDTAYHLAVARIMRHAGVLHAFPWTAYSWLADHYADKELLFHFLLMPVAGVEPFATAARVAGTVLGAGLLFALY